MKNGHYWVRFSQKLDSWVMMAVSNGYMYKADPSGLFDFGKVDEFMDRYPEIEIVEIEKPKEKMYKIDLNALNNNRQTEQTHPQNAFYVYVSESDKDEFLDSVAANARLRAESLLNAV